MILHPAVVAWAVNDMCKELEATKQRQLKDTKDLAMRRSMSRAYNAFIKEARTRYATVRVVKTKRGYTLRYLDEKDGTGPFDTVDEAVAWFLGGGR